MKLGILSAVYADPRVERNYAKSRGLLAAKRLKDACQRCFMMGVGRRLDSVVSLFKTSRTCLNQEKLNSAMMDLGTIETRLRAVAYGSTLAAVRRFRELKECVVTFVGLFGGA